MYQRIQSPSLQELQTRVADLLGATQVVVQFSAPEQYPPEVLAALNALCERHGDRLEVRFYGHYFGQAFDGNTLLALPQVQALTLDCLSQVERLERLESLQNLKCLAIGIDKLDLNPLLASRNLHALNRLRVFQEVGPKLDLKALSHMPNLCGLHLNAKAHSLQPVATLAGLTELSLYRQPASTTFEVVAQLPDLHRLAIGFGSREAMPELSSDSVRYLSLCRVRGLQALELERFPRLEVLDVEDQPHLARLSLAPCSRLRALRLANLKALASLDGLGEVPLARLSIYKTPALDLQALLEHPLPNLQAVRLASGKRALDQQLEARREALGIELLNGAIE